MNTHQRRFTSTHGHIFLALSLGSRTLGNSMELRLFFYFPRIMPVDIALPGHRICRGNPIDGTCGVFVISFTPGHAQRVRIYVGRILVPVS
jgi:hypothetical protein